MKRIIITISGGNEERAAATLLSEIESTAAYLEVDGESVDVEVVDGENGDD